MTCICICVVFVISAQNKNKIPFTSHKAERKLKVNQLDSIIVLLVDTASNFGVYKILYYDKDNKKRGLNFLFVDGHFYKEIYYYNGINRYYNKGYYHLKKYLDSTKLMKVDSYFLERYPPKI